jgi:hypothetical protein
MAELNDSTFGLPKVHVHHANHNLRKHNHQYSVLSRGYHGRSQASHYETGQTVAGIKLYINQCYLSKINVFCTLYEEVAFILLKERAPCKNKGRNP